MNQKRRNLGWIEPLVLREGCLSIPGKGGKGSHVIITDYPLSRTLPTINRQPVTNLHPSTVAMDLSMHDWQWWILKLGGIVLLAIAWLLLMVSPAIATFLDGLS